MWTFIFVIYIVSWRKWSGIWRSGGDWLHIGGCTGALQMTEYFYPENDVHCDSETPYFLDFVSSNGSL